MSWNHCKKKGIKLIPKNVSHTLSYLRFPNFTELFNRDGETRIRYVLTIKSYGRHGSSPFCLFPFKRHRFISESRTLEETLFIVQRFRFSHHGWPSLQTTTFYKRCSSWCKRCRFFVAGLWLFITLMGRTRNGLHISSLPRSYYIDLGSFFFWSTDFIEWN